MLDLDLGATLDDGVMTQQNAIAVSGLRKSYGDQVVLDGIDLDVTAGTVFALSAPTVPARPPL